MLIVIVYRFPYRSDLFDLNRLILLSWIEPEDPRMTFGNIETGQVT